jgi:hypothetical protein
MSTPKKPSLADMNKFADTAIENKEKDEIKKEENKEVSEPAPEEKPTKKTKAKKVPEPEELKKKKVGRKASRPGCTEKIYFTTTPETKERIQLAILQEKIKETKKGNSLFDQSSFLENAVLDYLKRHKY